MIKLRLKAQVDELNRKLNERDGQLKSLVLQIDSTESGNKSARIAVKDAEELTNTMQMESTAIRMIVTEALTVPRAQRTIEISNSKSIFRRRQ